MKTRRILTIGILFALLLPLPGLAKQQYCTIAEVREQASEGWRQTYTAHGREIVIDVMPQAPQVDAFPMVEVKRLPLPIALPEAPGWAIHPNTQKGMDEDPSYFGYDLGGFESSVPATIGGQKVKYGPHRMYYGDVFEPEGYHLPGSELNFREITDILRQTLANIGLPDGVIDPSRPTSLNAHAYYGASATEFLAPGWAFIDNEQQLHGIPIYQHGLPSASDYENYSMNARFSFNFHTPQQYNLGGYLVSESQLLAEDVPLCSFAQVQKALGKEILAGRLRHIFELKLCYALASPPGLGSQREYYLNMDTPGYSVPVWVAEVLWTENPRKELAPAFEEPGGFEAPDARNTLSYRRLMVNAQTGKLYDPQSKDRNRGFYEGFKSWDDVGGK